jgi:hypothetical protein
VKFERSGTLIRCVARNQERVVACYVEYGPTVTTGAVRRQLSRILLLLLRPLRRRAVDAKLRLLLRPQSPLKLTHYSKIAEAAAFSTRSGSDS